MNKKLLISLGSLLSVAIVTPILATVSCSSETSTKTNLIITIKKDPVLTSADISILEADNLSDKLIPLQKLFDGQGLIAENLDKFTISIDKEKSVVTLTAKDNYTIDDKTTLISNTYTINDTNLIDLKITINNVAQKLTANEASDLKGTDITKQLIVLKKLFNGINDTNQNNFTVSISNDNVVTLTAKADYTFGGKPSLSALPFSIETAPVDKNLNITAKSAKTDLTGIELMDVVGQDAAKQLTILTKLFDGVDSGNQVNFTTTIGSGNVVTLTAKNGYKFNGKDSLNSTPYNINVININIVANPATKLNKTQEILLMLPSSQEISLSQRSVVSKLFTGITEINFNYFTFSVKDKVVTLNAKTGFVFGTDVSTGKDTLVAPPYTIEVTPPTNDVNLNISIITPTENITTQDINNLKGTDIPQQVISLSKLFKGIVASNIPNFDFKINESTKTITLTAKKGFIFGVGTTAKNSIESNVFTEEFTSFDIVANTSNLFLTQNEVNAIKDATNQKDVLAALNKLFQGIFPSNINNLTITIDETNHKVIVKPNYGYVLASGAKNIEATYQIK
ncbi:MAG: hypothetical protein ACRCRP_00505 [Metamycoplasmataceae bacterium]